MKLPFEISDHLYLTLQTERGTPLALRLSTPKLYRLICLISFVAATLFIGTLLFFRELEVNRKLTEQLLDLRTRQSVNRLLTNAPVILGPTVPLTAKAPLDAQVSKESEGETSSQKVESLPTLVGARIGDLSTDCQLGRCQVKIDLLPSGSGTAAGGLLVVLETEIPRIGSANPYTGEVRKKYLVYPGGSSLEALPAETISKLDRKNFRFSRVLQTSAQLDVGTALKPLATNIYLFDTNGTVIHHERKVIKPLE